MNILASMALRRARGQLNSVQSRAAGSQSTPAVATTIAPATKDVVITGPINRYMFLQGREWAIDMVASLRAAPVELVVERLTGATEGRPGSYAAGIQSVVDELKNADATGQAEEENLTSQVGRKE
ncbi:hypothetical protein BGP84_06515 [Pseudomonas putida]|uniref:Uncharacterized protein n=1 Tax=Pseudomonas putida TaxID=303 RepID=A0A2S3X1T3_PSEPU|nr:hypothetical protein [Pseudomonas putida]POG09399.1 hypothetical protein BGP84_06515 [Pseudomonas putida]POG15543.1 hypothetical protein BGP85_05000 [Pseudomonas putida]